jgi:uncharacterized protein
MNEKKKPEEMELPDILAGRRQLGPEDTFEFGCHPGVSCFTDCCADINIILTPLDVLKLSRRVGMETGEFLTKHTLTPLSRHLQLPVVVLKMDEENEERCPFLGEQGCGVYEDRPWACRMYPVGSALPPARAGVEPEPIYFLFEDDFCKGREETAGWTVSQWLENQGIDDRDDLEVGHREIVSHPWFIGGTRQLDPKRIEMYHMACYNLDTFRRFVTESTFLSRFEVSDEEAKVLETDDEALLKFAYRWVRFALFAEPTIKVREDAKPK